VSTWFLYNAKTAAIIVGTRQLLAGTQTSAGVSVAGTAVHFAEAVKLLGLRYSGNQRPTMYIICSESVLCSRSYSLEFS